MARGSVIHEHGLREVQVCGDRLSLIAGERATLKKDAERVATVAVRTDENFQDVELLRDGQNMFL